MTDWFGQNQRSQGSNLRPPLLYRCLGTQTSILKVSISMIVAVEPG